MATMPSTKAKTPATQGAASAATYLFESSQPPSRMLSTPSSPVPHPAPWNDDAGEELPAPHGLVDEDHHDVHDSDEEPIPAEELNDD